jgi:hypothetical protein
MPPKPTTQRPELVRTEVFDQDAVLGLLRAGGVARETKELLRRYIKQAKNGNEVTVVYKRSKKLQEADIGRVYAEANLGLSAMDSGVRAHLAAKFYFDVDIINCIPTLLALYAAKNGWGTPCLKNYVDDRSTILSSIAEHYGVDAADAKCFVLTQIFGGSVEGVAHQAISMDPFRRWDLSRHHPFLQARHAEMREVMVDEMVLEPELMAVVKQGMAPGSNVMGSLLATRMFDIENDVLMAFVKHMEARGRQVDSLVFDGAHVRRQNDDDKLTAEELREVEDAIYIDLS